MTNNKADKYVKEDENSIVLVTAIRYRASYEVVRLTHGFTMRWWRQVHRTLGSVRELPLHEL